MRVRSVSNTFYAFFYSIRLSSMRPRAGAITPTLQSFSQEGIMQIEHAASHGVYCLHTRSEAISLVQALRKAVSLEKTTIPGLTTSCSLISIRTRLPETLLLWITLVQIQILVVKSYYNVMGAGSYICLHIRRTTTRLSSESPSSRPGLGVISMRYPLCNSTKQR